MNELRDKRMARNLCPSNINTVDNLLKIPKSKPGRCYKLHRFPSRAPSLILN